MRKTNEYEVNRILEESIMMAQGKKLEWIVHENIRVHGLEWAANHAKKTGIGFSVFYYAMFGKFPTR